MKRTAITILALLATVWVLGLTPDTLRAQDDDQGDGNDLVVLHAVGSAPQERYNWGRLAEQSLTRITYSAEGREPVELYPWNIQWVKYGNQAIPEEWQNAYFNLTSEQYRDAARAFDHIISEEIIEDIGQLRRVRGPIVWATHYYCGYAYNRLGAETDRYGQTAYRNLLDEYPVNLGDRQREDRNAEFERNPDLLDRAKEVAITAVNRVHSALGVNESDAGEAFVEAVEDAEDADTLDEVVRTFPDFYAVFSREHYERAIWALRRLFNPEEFDRNFRLDNDLQFQEVRPFWFYKIAWEAARAYHGLRQIEMAIAILDHTKVANDPGNHGPEDPSLVSQAQEAARREQAYIRYQFDAWLYAAKIWETHSDPALGFREALVLYRTVMDQTRQYGQRFQAFYNEANLRYGLALAQSNPNAAEGHFLRILENFLEVDEDEFLPTYLVDPNQASLYAGAYLGLGQVKLIQASRERGRHQAEARAEALRYYLVVTSMFSADREKRAEALYYASRIYREIAEEQFAEDFAHLPERIDDPEHPGDESRQHPNPYYYYLTTADSLERELRQHYADTRWATME